MPAGGGNPLLPRPPHYPAKAKHVIFLYLSGGVSHMDSFDPKPRLVADAGKLSSSKPGGRWPPILERLARCADGWGRGGSVRGCQAGTWDR